MGTETPTFRTLLDIALCAFATGCSFLSFIINCNTKYSISLCSMGCSSKLLNLRRGVVETLDLLAKLDRSMGNLGIQYLELTSETIGLRDLWSLMLT